MSSGRFPVPLAVDDFRFGFLVTAAVARVLAVNGFPDIMSHYDSAPADFERLQDMLHGFLYDMPAADALGCDDSPAQPTSVHPDDLPAYSQGGPL